MQTFSLVNNETKKIEAIISFYGAMKTLELKGEHVKETKHYKPLKV